MQGRLTKEVIGAPKEEAPEMPSEEAKAGDSKEKPNKKGRLAPLRRMDIKQEDSPFEKVKLKKAKVIQRPKEEIELEKVQLRGHILEPLPQTEEVCLSDQPLHLYKYVWPSLRPSAHLLVQNVIALVASSNFRTLGGAQTLSSFFA